MPMLDGRKILIVDDEVEFCRTLEDFFSCENFQVESANDGEEGLIKARTWEPDLIILDILMPKKGGIYFLENFDRARETPIIVVSAIYNHGTPEKCEDLGVADYITKPVDLMNLLYQVEKLLKV
jgi:DNA-binding response OmpR family regulator